MHYHSQLDGTFFALSDPTRRGILQRLAGGPATIGELAGPYGLTLNGVRKHVGVLERAGLVTKVRRGREQLVHTDRDAVSRARRVLDELETAWRGRVDRMADLLAGDGG